MKIEQMAINMLIKSSLSSRVDFVNHFDFLYSVIMMVILDSDLIEVKR